MQTASEPAIDFNGKSLAPLASPLAPLRTRRRETSAVDDAEYRSGQRGIPVPRCLSDQRERVRNRPLVVRNAGHCAACAAASPGWAVLPPFAAPKGGRISSRSERRNGF